MSAPKDGGPAFPQPYDSIEHTQDGRELASGWTGTPDPGMSLRAWFAGRMLGSLIANPNIVAHNARSGWGLVNCTEEQVCEYAVALADALISELAKQTEVTP